jgi:outer membrane protein TolC
MVALLCLLLGGQLSCARQHPLLQPAVREELRTGLPLQPEALATEAPKMLADVPLEPAVEVITRARQVTSPDVQTPTVRLTLPEVRQNALQHNLALQVELFNPSIAEAGYQGERWKFEAVLEAGLNYDHAKDLQGIGVHTISVIPSVRIPTQAGGVVSLTLPFTRRDSEQLIPGVVPPLKQGRTDTTNIEFNLEQPLLRDAGFEINYASINTAGLLMRQTDARTKLAAIRVLVNAEQFYWQHYAAHENLKVQLQQYESALEQVRTAQRLVEEGARTKIEVTRAQSDAARRFEGIITAETSRRQTELALKRVINAPDLSIQSQTIILPITPPTPMGLRLDREKIIELALRHRMELFENEVQLALDRVSLQVSRNRVLPDVRFNFRYAFSGEAPEFDTALEQLFDRKLDRYAIGLTASVPLAGNQQARYQALQSALILSQTTANRQALTQAIQEEVLNAANGVELHWQRILSNRTAVARAQETYDDNKLEFQLGTITSTELLLTLDQLAQAQSALVFSLSDFQNALVDLAFATGTVLGQGGVLWTPATQLGGRSDSGYTPPGR